MKTMNMFVVAMPTLALGLTPLAARAETYEDCADACATQCAEATSPTAGAAGDLLPEGSGSARATPFSDVFTMESIRTEERARAAEEFNAQEEDLTAQHKAEIDKVRAEERAKVDAAQRSSDEARLDAVNARAENDEVINDALVTGLGLYGFVGGGATNFTQPTAVGTTGTGGYWDARVGLGSRSIIGAEVGYNGSARDISALGLNNDAFLLGNGVEGILRLNVPITEKDTAMLVEPYTFAGAGWTRYNVMTDGANTSSVDDSDDIMTVPLGVGLAFGYEGFTVDTRATYRQALFSDLVGSPTSSFAPTALNSWGIGAALGFEF